MIIFLPFRSNPFYEPKPTSPNNLVNTVQEGETERRVKRRAPAPPAPLAPPAPPAPPALTPKTGVNENTVVSAGKDLSTSPKVRFHTR
jgi:hypothetical protein